MVVAMPEPDRAVLVRRDRIVKALSAIVPGEGVIASEAAMRPYETDGLTAYRALPMVVVLPSTTDQVSRILAYCHREGIKVVPRGAGTSLSGGALPLVDGVLLGMAKFNRILEIDYDNRVVVAEPGVTNLAVTQAVEQRGFYYAPDPSSQIACTIGGNVAENSGGVHCLKYGMTSNNVLGCEIALMTGEVVRLGGKHVHEDEQGHQAKQDRHHRITGLPHHCNGHRTRIRNRRCAGIAYQRDRTALRQQLQYLLRRAPLVVLVQSHERHADTVMPEQPRRDTGILGCNCADALQHIERAQRNVGEVSNRRRDYI